MNATPDDDYAMLQSYLLGKLPPDACNRVEQRMLIDDSYAREFIRLSVEESILREWAAGVKRVREVDQVVQAMQIGPLHIRSVHTKTWARRWVLLLGATAAIILITLSIAIWRGRSIDLPGGPPVARFAAIRGGTWPANWPRISPGTGIPAGWKIELLAGSAEIEYANGTHINFNGPCVYQLSSATTGYLTSGKLLAYVPPSAVGFSIETRALNVIDKGTRFGLHTERDELEVHVFEGTVEARAMKSKSGAPISIPLHISQAARFDQAGRLTRWITPDYAGFGAPKLAPGIVSTSQHVHWLASAPPSLEQGKLMSDDSVFLILERRDIVLKSEIAATFLQPKGPGTRSEYSNNVQMIPAGTHIDSYLLHCDRNSKTKFMDGSVVFDRPIIAVIARGKQLLATDHILGAPETQYESKEVETRGLEGGRGKYSPDVLLFSHGPNGVGVRFETSPDDGLDELRILVMSEK